MEPVRPRVRVALLATSVEFGGIEKVLLTLLQHMDSTIELVPVLFTRTDTHEKSFFEKLHALGVKYETLYVNSFRPIVYATPLINLAQAVALFRRQRFDLVHCHGYRADVFGAAISLFCRIPLVSTVHGHVANDRRLRFYNRLDTVVLRRFNRVIAVSSSMKDYLVGRGLDATRVEVVTNAVASVPTAEREASRAALRSSLGIGDHEFVFGYVGRLSEEKGMQYLVQAFLELTAGHPVRLLAVGDGQQRADLERLVRERGLDSRVHLVGFQSETARWYAAMDAFVLPSLTEGTPMALLEAMAHRLPVIASAVGGVPAVVTDRENGLLVRPADVPMLADAMKTLLSSPPLCRQLSEAAACAVSRRYDVKTWIQRVRDIYAAAIHESAVAR